jgi:hypothetical protein
MKKKIIEELTASRGCRQFFLVQYEGKVLNLSKNDKFLLFFFGWFKKNVYFCISKFDK